MLPLLLRRVLLFVTLLLGCGTDHADGETTEDFVWTNSGWAAETRESDSVGGGEEGSEFVMRAGPGEETVAASYCESELGCERGETCLENECQQSCFENTECGDDTCRWDSAGEPVCVAPWTCTLGRTRTVIVEGGCSWEIECESEDARSYEFYCENTTCQCLQDGKVVAEIEIDHAYRTAACSPTDGLVSALNSRCGWAIALPE